MSQYVTLVGAEEVSRAAHTMSSAASTMSSAASSIDSSLDRHQRFMSEWLERFEEALTKVAGESTP